MQISPLSSTICTQSMAMDHSVCATAALVALLLLSLHPLQAATATLSSDFYANSCKNLEAIVKRESYRIYKIHGNFAVSGLRNIWHDCAVDKCDAGVLLRGPGVEEKSDLNFALRNFKYFNVVKQAVVKECGNVVSCADILLLAGREGIYNLGGPYIPLKLGRLDTRVSLKSHADEQLPARNSPITDVLRKCSELGLDAELCTALLGAHTVGRTHCVNLAPRLYPTVDPTLDPAYSNYLKKRCPVPNPKPVLTEYARNDRETPMGFDNHYFVNVKARKGLLNVDQDLWLDPRTQPFVDKFAASNDYFFLKFTQAVQILTDDANSLTGPPGEIRLRCDVPNSL